MISEKNFFVKSFETFLLRNCYNSLFINYINGLQDADGGVPCGVWVYRMREVGWVAVCGFVGCGVAG